MHQEKYPILEFDSAMRAVIEPSELFKPIDISEHCVICYFGNVVRSVAENHNAAVVFEDKGVYGTIPFYQIEHEGKSIVFIQPLVGAPIAAAIFEIAFALGCRKFIACGGAGVLDREVPVGAFVIPDSAVRDEGTSYHYLRASRQVEANPRVVDVIKLTLDDHGESYRTAKTWTTDGLFRETDARVRRRKEEGCLTVEMEAAALFAVANFRGADLGYILYSGDDVSGETWDQRLEEPRMSTTEKLFWLSVEACLRL